MNEFSLDACLARIERWQPRINAFVHVDRNPAKAQTGPLSGLPLAHKDMFFRSGKVSNCGSKIRRGWVASETSTALERLDAAGAPPPMAHYCQGILAGETLYAAGQIASDYQTGVPPEARQDPAFPYYGSNIQKQARYVLNNLRSVFQAAGCDFKDVVKSQVFLTDLNDFYYFDQVWKEFFPSPPPRTTVQVSGLLVPGCRIEIDLTAVLP